MWLRPWAFRGDVPPSGWHRYLKLGADGLHDRSSRPLASPQRTSVRLEERNQIWLNSWAIEWATGAARVRPLRSSSDFHSPLKDSVRNLIQPVQADRFPKGFLNRPRDVAELCNGGQMTSFVVSSGGAGYGFLVDDQGRLRQAGFGPNIDAHMQRLPAGIPPALYPLAYPAYDEEPTRAPSLRVTHGDGTTTTRLRVADVRVVGPETVIFLVDPDCPLEVTLYFHTEDHGVLRQWVSITNRQPGAVTLHEVAAASPLLAVASPHLTHFGGGDWSAEWTTSTESLTPGTKVVDSRGGVQPHLRACPFFLLAPDGLPEESSGAILAGALAWGGNTRFAFERTTAPTVRVWCGHNSAAAEYAVDPGATFVTPEQVWVWSTEGVGPLSRRLHRWVREHATRDGDQLRPIVVNNWEATAFSFDTERLLGLIDDTADLGAELFLLDDGWFGDAHHRDDDTVGLGDWRVDEAKLPGGLGALIARAESAVSGSGCGSNRRWSTRTPPSMPSIRTGW